MFGGKMIDILQPTLYFVPSLWVVRKLEIEGFEHLLGTVQIVVVQNINFYV
jgi:hypothetical protein